MGIASLDTSGPTSSNLLSTGAADIRALRAAIRESFVNFGIGTDVVTATAAQINGAPNKAGAETISGAWVFTAPVTVPLGSPSAPSVAFAGDSNTGMYSEGSNVINFATEGVERLSITGSEVMLQQPMQVPDGTVSLPSLTFKDDTDTGFYRSNGGEVSFVADGLIGARFNVSGLSLHRISSNWTGIQFYNSAGDRRGLLDLDSEDGNLALYPVYGAGPGSYGTVARNNTYVFAWDSVTERTSFGFPIMLGAESAVVPAISFGDVGTGLYRVAPSQLGVALGGAAQFTFTAAGLEGPATGVASADNRYSTNAGVVAYVTAALAEIASTASLYKNPHTLAGTASEVGSTWTVNPNAPAVGTSVTATTNGRLTANADGVYRVDLSCSVSLAAGVSSIMGIRKNGSALTGSAQQTVSSIDGGLVPFSSSVLVSLNSTDYVSLYAYAPSGVGTLYNAQFLMQRIA